MDPLELSLNQSFQSIGVTKEWRRQQAAVVRVLVALFPINRRHQRMATTAYDNPSRFQALKSFQSIGATKEWRLILTLS